MQPPKPRTRWTLAIVSLALFMVVLDNLIVTVALPSIHEDLGATLQQLEWTVNAYTLAFAVTLIPGAAVGDRFGRKRTFLAGLALFTASSAAAALAPGASELVAARALQGIGGAIVAPLTLTLLAEAFPPERRGAALGIWSGISGLGIALGPLVGGAVVSGLSWQWIFWINVPLGVVLLPLAAVFLRESHGEATRLDLPGVGLVTTGLFALVFGLVRGQGEGWTSPLIVGSLSAGAVLLALFVAHERRTEAPMVPLDLFAKRAFAVTNAVSFFMYFGTFGSIFLITQFVQQVMGYAPFDAGVRMLVWTGATAITSPIAGILAERRGPRTLMALGLALQAGGAGVAGDGVGRRLDELRARRPVRDRRRRHGPRVRAVGECAAQRRGATPRRAGVGHEQRDPRGRRRLRCRRDVDDLLGRRRLHLAAGLRRRLPPGAVGRRGGGRGRRGRGAAAPGRPRGGRDGRHGRGGAHAAPLAAAA